jgi:hypothetical protein
MLIDVILRDDRQEFGTACPRDLYPQHEILSLMYLEQEVGACAAQVLAT